MFIARAALPVLLLASLSACDTATAPVSGTYETAQSVTIKGQLSYRERIALPADARAVLTLSDVSIADKKAPVIKKKIIELEGRQVPIPFTLKTDAGQLKDGRRYALRGTIIDPQDALLWTTDTVYPVTSDSPTQDLGKLQLVRVEPRPALAPDIRDNRTDYYTCSDKTVKIDWQDDYINMTLNGKTSKLPRVVSASGAKYESGTDAARRMFWSKGETGTLALGSKSHDCKKIGEPPYGHSPLTGEWTVTDIDGTPALDNTEVSLKFTDDGKLSGSTGCNNYGAAVEADNESVEITDIFQTKRACPGEIGEQENRFTAILGNITGFKIDNDTLTLKTDAGKRLTAER